MRATIALVPGGASSASRPFKTYAPRGRLRVGTVLPAVEANTDNPCLDDAGSAARVQLVLSD